MTFLARPLSALFALALLALTAGTTPALAEAADKVAVPEGYPERVLGDADAPVTIYEYASLTCGHCANFHTDTLPELKAQFIETGKAKLVFRDFPLDRLSLAGHLMARCAPESLYFPLMGVLFEQQENWISAENPLQAMMQYARLAGLGDDAIDACFKNEKLLTQIQSVQDSAKAVYGINSTPSFVIDGQVLAGNRPIEEFAAAIKAAQ